MHEPYFFELWGLPALFSLCGLRPFKIHAKTSTRGACENQVCSFWMQKGLGCMSHIFLNYGASLLCFRYAGFVLSKSMQRQAPVVPVKIKFVAFGSKRV